MSLVRGLDGELYLWKLYRYTIHRDKLRKARSKYHLRARKVILEVYGSYKILEEVKLPGCDTRKFVKGPKNSVLYLDFFIPNIDLAIEVHGEQHYEHIPFFHPTKADFVKAQIRDDNKIEWCRINDIDLVTLKYSDSEDDWKEQLRKRGDHS